MGRAPFAVRWQGPNNPRDYITVVLKGAREGEYGVYEYTAKGNPLSVLAPPVAGRVCGVVGLIFNLVVHETCGKVANGALTQPRRRASLGYRRRRCGLNLTTSSTMASPTGSQYRSTGAGARRTKRLSSNNARIESASVSRA